MDGMKHGTGVVQGPHHRYEGEWKNDRMEGRGKLRWKTSRLPDSGEEEYEGEWRAGVQHGTGTQTTFNHRGRKTKIYQGEWRDGLKHGQGRELSPKGVVQRAGTWERGVFVKEGEGGTTAEETLGSPQSTAATTTPRKRGRPPKSKPVVQ
jgi:hypothetical protein